MLKPPITISENRDWGAVLCDAVYGKVLGANHEVKVGGTGIDPCGQELLFTHIVSALIAIGKSLAKGQMAACVLIKQGAQEQHAGISDGAVEGNQGNLAKAAGVLIGFHDGAQNVFANLCVQIGHCTVGESKGEVLDK